MPGRSQLFGRGSGVAGEDQLEAEVVVGCGPTGLAVILMLKAWEVRTVIASDFSPGRRALAEACGADVVIENSIESGG
jgi:threonine dehydrogenase-like Zn-dependent dehydrogenase